MTAEVAILNRQAIALAADSAVTVSGPYGQKIFNTVNKLFSLSKYHPVGIMVYSSATVMEVPVETVIKVFRKNLGTQSFDSLKGYHDAFLDFLTENNDMFTEEMRLVHSQSVIESIFDGIKRNAFNALIREFPGLKEPKKEQKRQTALKFLVQSYGNSVEANDLPGVTNQVRNRVKRETAAIVERWKHTFRQELSLTIADVNVLSDIALAAVLKDGRNAIETGFVIAGFGEKQIFPQLLSFEFESSLYGVHKTFEGQAADASRWNAQIVPFAQREMIDTFVYGRALSLDVFLEHFIREFFEDEKSNVKHLPEAQQIFQFLDDMGDRLVGQFNQRLEDFTVSKHAIPLRETVAAMPKEELAIMAEALINLTAIKRRMSPDAETVGGPTDVAVISKGDGFIWIKRKHYFDGELNQQFGYNYNREDK